MVFSSPVFIFGFLPLVLFFYYLSPRGARNLVLLLSSLLFYAWGEVFYIWIMLLSIAVNFLTGILIGSLQLSAGQGRGPKLALAAGVSINLGLLVACKYANFIVDNLNLLHGVLGVASVELAPVHLPLGISFFTFQAISYLVDVYRGETPAQKNILRLALYISLFPQLIAGPIVRYHDIAAQITCRQINLDVFAGGVQRFVLGLGKKVLVGDPLGEVADGVFALPGEELSSTLAWLGILAYTLHIYFDFSGYSDMAIGLARMFGFRLLENFNYPYISTSIREFWRRWHISLSTWFRDYVYIPLGGNRRSQPRVYLNLLSVFFLTGLWHGASWNFIVWGLFHGIFLAAEHAGFSRVLDRSWRWLGHIYVLAVVIFGWVFFRAENLPHALAYIGAMLEIWNYHTPPVHVAQLLSREAALAFAAGALFSLPLYPRLHTRFVAATASADSLAASALFAVRAGLVAAILFVSLLKISAATYSPFIYFRF